MKACRAWVGGVGMRRARGGQGKGDEEIGGRDARLGGMEGGG